MNRSTRWRALATTLAIALLAIAVTPPPATAMTLAYEDVVVQKNELVVLKNVEVLAIKDDGTVVSVGHIDFVMLQIVEPARMAGTDAMQIANAPAPPTVDRQFMAPAMANFFAANDDTTATYRASPANISPQPAGTNALDDVTLRSTWIEKQDSLRSTAAARRSAAHVATQVASLITQVHHRRPAAAFIRIT